jgi:hypothetical protein
VNRGAGQLIKTKPCVLQGLTLGQRQAPGQRKFKFLGNFSGQQFIQIARDTRAQFARGEFGECDRCDFAGRQIACEKKDHPPRQ